MSKSATHTQDSAVDAITPGSPTPFHGNSGSDRPSLRSSGGEPDVDDKSSAPVAQYDFDPEKQSDRVGSVHRDAVGDEEAGWRLQRSEIWVLDQRWLSFSWIWNTFRPLWHFLIWGVFTASVYSCTKAT